MTDVRETGVKFSGEDSSPPLWIRVILAAHHSLGAVWSLIRILENKVARK